MKNNQLNTDFLLKRIIQTKGIEETQPEFTSALMEKIHSEAKAGIFSYKPVISVKAGLIIAASFILIITAAIISLPNHVSSSRKIPLSFDFLSVSANYLTKIINDVLTGITISPILSLIFITILTLLIFDILLKKFSESK